MSRTGSGSQDPSHHPGQEQGKPGDTRAVPDLGIRHLSGDRGGMRLSQDVGTWVRISPVSMGPWPGLGFLLRNAPRNPCKGKHCQDYVQCFFFI